MKRFIAVIAALAIMAPAFSCAGWFNQTPEMKLASDVYFDTKAGAAYNLGADRVSKANAVIAGEKFYANCDTFSRTVADLLIRRGADPADVWLVNVSIPTKGFSWVNNGNGWQRVKSTPHQIVIYKGIAIDNVWGALTPKDLEWEYVFNKKMNMRDQKWVEWNWGSL